MPRRPIDTARAMSLATCVRDCRKLSASRALIVTLTVEALAWLYEHGRVTSRETDEDGRTRLVVRLHPAALGRFERQYPHLAG